MPRTPRTIGLVDCLVVLSTVAVAVGLVASALDNTQAHRLRDMELRVLRDLAAALHTYSVEDPTNVLGPVHPGSAGFLGEGYSDYGGGPGLAPFVRWGEDFDPSNRPLNRLLYGFDGMPIPIDQQTEPGDRSVYSEFQCLGNDLGWQDVDSHVGFPVETEAPYFQTNGTSFRVNNLVTTDNIEVGIYGRPTNRIPLPSATLALMEARAFQTALTSENSPFGTMNLDLTGYHDRLGFFMLAYADGRASFEDMRSDTYTPTGLGPHPFIRGTWGRMDCAEDPMLSP